MRHDSILEATSEMPIQVGGTLPFLNLETFMAVIQRTGAGSKHGLEPGPVFCTTAIKVSNLYKENHQSNSQTQTRLG